MLNPIFAGKQCLHLPHVLTLSFFGGITGLEYNMCGAWIAPFARFIGGSALLRTTKYSGSSCNVC